MKENKLSWVKPKDFSWINDCLIHRKQKVGLGLGLWLAFVMKGLLTKLYIDLSRLIDTSGISAIQYIHQGFLKGVDS